MPAVRLVTQWIAPWVRSDGIAGSLMYAEVTTRLDQLMMALGFTKAIGRRIAVPGQAITIEFLEGGGVHDTYEHPPAIITSRATQLAQR